MTHHLPFLTAKIMGPTRAGIGQQKMKPAITNIFS